MSSNFASNSSIPQSLPPIIEKDDPYETFTPINSSEESSPLLIPTPDPPILSKKRRLSRSTLLFLSLSLGASIVARSIGVGITIGLSTPYFETNHLPSVLISLNWIAYPICGVLGGTLISAISDRIFIPYFGRRRPFLMMSGILLSISLAIWPNSHLLGGGFGSLGAQIISVGMFWLFNFGGYVVAVMVKALLVDRIPIDDQSSAVTIVITLGNATGTLLAFGLIAIPWQKVFVGAARTPLQPVCLFVNLITLLMISLTCWLVREYEELEGPSKEKKDVKRCSILKFLPFSFWLNVVVQLLMETMRIVAFIYMSTYVGEAVFHGDPAAEPGSPQHDLYLEGVQWCSIGLVLTAISGMAYAPILNLLARCIHFKILWVFGSLLQTASFFLGGFIPNKWLMLGILACFGVGQTTCITIPWTLCNLITKSDPRLQPHQASIQNIFQLACSLPAIVVAVFGGLVLKLFEDVFHWPFGSLFVLSGAFGLISMFLSLFVRLPKGVKFSS